MTPPWLRSVTVGNLQLINSSCANAMHSRSADKVGHLSTIKYNWTKIFCYKISALVLMELTFQGNKNNSQNSCIYYERVKEQKLKCRTDLKSRSGSLCKYSRALARCVLGSSSAVRGPDWLTSCLYFILEKDCGNWSNLVAALPPFPSLKSLLQPGLPQKLKTQTCCSAKQLVSKVRKSSFTLRKQALHHVTVHVSCLVWYAPSLLLVVVLLWIQKTRIPSWFHQLNPPKKI